MKKRPSKREFQSKCKCIQFIWKILPTLAYSKSFRVSINLVKKISPVEVGKFLEFRRHMSASFSVLFGGKLVQFKGYSPSNGKEEELLKARWYGQHFSSTCTQHCCVAIWKTLLHVLPPTSNIVTQQLISTSYLFLNKTSLSASFSIMPKGEVIQATNCCNLQRNIVELQVEKRCWPYYHPPQTLSRIKICCCKLKKK